MPKKNERESEYTEMTSEEQDQIVAQRLRQAEHQLFDAKLSLDVETEALAKVPEEERKARLQHLERAVSEAKGRVRALQGRRS